MNRLKKLQIKIDIEHMIYKQNDINVTENVREWIANGNWVKEDM